MSFQSRSHLLYFPFPDGTWSFNCRVCGSKCCRGYGFGATQNEFAKLKRVYKDLPLFSERDGNGFVQLINYQGACHFLESDGLCGVQRRHGRELKPHVCRMFPINRCFLGDGVLVVAPNHLCPLRHVSEFDQPPPDELIVRHADLAQQVEGAWEGVVATTPKKSAAQRQWTRAIADTERVFADQVHAHPGSLFDAWQSAIGDGVSIADTAELVCSVLGTEFHPSSVADNLRLRSLTALVRFHILQALPFMPSEDALSITGEVFAGLSVFIAAAERMSGRPLTLEQTTAAVVKQWWVALLLGVHDKVAWFEKAESGRPLHSPGDDTTLAALMTHIDKAEQPIGEILTGIVGDDLPARLHLLAQLRRYAEWLRFS